MDYSVGERQERERELKPGGLLAPAEIQCGGVISVSSRWLPGVCVRVSTRMSQVKWAFERTLDCDWIWGNRKGSNDTEK